jgi:hypothetical protein
MYAGSNLSLYHRLVQTVLYRMMYVGSKFWDWPCLYFIE